MTASQTQTHLEKETKFEGDVEIDPRELAALPGVAKVERPAPEELDAVYYDSADLRLLAHGCTLRRRTGGHDAGWHLKLPAGPGARQEIRVPADGAPTAVPEALLRHVRAYVRGQEPVPVLHLHTHRRRLRLTDRKERTLAEIAQDRVSAQVLGTERLSTEAPAPAGQDSAGTSTRITAWSEVEVELDRGDDGLLRAAETLLTASGLRRSPDPSKLAHALACTAPRTPRAPRPAPGSAAEAIMARLTEQTAALYATDPAVRADEPDAVHRMRVAARRLRSLLRTYRGLLDRSRTDPVAAELRWLGRVLGDARDQEVLAARLHEGATGLPGRLVLGPVAERIAAAQRGVYQHAWQRAVVGLDSPRYYALLDALDALNDVPPLRPKAAKKVLPQLVKAARREQRRLRSRIEAAESAPPGPERDAALHAARKAAKRARYAGEVAAPYAGKPARRFVRRAKAVQELLGAHQDSVVARAVLPSLAERAQAAGESAFSYGLLHAREQALAEECERRLPDVWRRARKRRLTRFG